MNESQKPGISHTPKEGVQQEKLKEEIVGHIRKGEELLDTYIQQATRETLQHALKQGLVECIEKGQWLSKKYTELTDAETWNSIKANNQEEIKRGFVVRIKEGGDFPRNLLDLATEETLDYIKSNHQEEVRQGIIAYVARRSGILALYLKLANEDTLQSAVKQSILNGLVSGECLTERFLDLLSENSRNEIKESHEQEVIEGIASSVKKGVKVPEKYLELTTGDHLQTALAHWLPAKIGRGESIPKKYLEIASEEVLASIRANHQKEIERGIGHCVWSGKNIPKYLKDLATEESVQAGLCYGFTHYARTGVAIPEYYLKLATPATIQSSMHIFLVGGMKSAIPDISPSYAKLATPETMQSALREVFLDCMKSEKNMSPALHAKITKESYEIIKKEHQIDIQQAIMWWYVQKKSGWPTEYMNLATKETVQAALKQAFVHYVKDNRRIPVEYLDMATDETLEAVLVLAFFESLQKGGDLSQKYIGHFVKQGNLQQFAQGVLLKTAQE
ncbi:MAG: hypothetical protein Q8P55_02525, partial [bacterium]|nr:hypothetical protein [bacterium]